MPPTRILYFGLLLATLVTGLVLVLRPGAEAPSRPHETAGTTIPLSLPERQNATGIPRIAEPVWMRNAAASPPLDGLIPIAIVIDDMGHNPEWTDAVIDLPAPLTLSFLPYPALAGEQARTARTRGHEIMLHMPMESADPAADEGPAPLLLVHDEKQSEARLASALAAIPGAVGLNNHMGSLYTEDPLHMAWLAEMVAGRGLLFLDSRTSPRTRGVATMQAAGVPVLERDVFLDNDRSRDAIRRQLETLEQVAREQGHAVGIGHPYRETITVLEDWLTGLSEKGFVLVPASRLLMDGTGGRAGTMSSED